MVKTNQDIISGQCIKNDDCVLAVSNEDRKTVWKSYHEKLLNTEFAWDRKSLSQTDTVSSILCLIDNGMVKISINDS